MTGCSSRWTEGETGNAQTFHSTNGNSSGAWEIILFEECVQRFRTQVVMNFLFRNLQERCHSPRSNCLKVFHILKIVHRFRRKNGRRFVQSARKECVYRLNSRVLLARESKGWFDPNGNNFIVVFYSRTVYFWHCHAILFTLLLSLQKSVQYFPPVESKRSLCMFLTIIEEQEEE